MEDNKNAMRLDDEKLEQVTGGWAECPTYQEVLEAKNDGGGYYIILYWQTAYSEVPV